MVLADNFLESIVELAEAVVVDNPRAYPEDRDFALPFYSCHAYEAVADNHRDLHPELEVVVAVWVDYSHFDLVAAAVVVANLVALRLLHRLVPAVVEVNYSPTTKSLELQGLVEIAVVAILAEMKCLEDRLQVVAWDHC